MVSAMAVVLLLMGCGERGANRSATRSVSSADCAYAVRYGHETYAEVGYLDAVGMKLGKAAVGAKTLAPTHPASRSRMTPR
jgi:uncharacterized lipoprotein NlpE involved in copper resistance